MRRALPLVLLALLVAACDSAPSVVEATSTVTVSYVGTLADGTVFDQSASATFPLQNTILGFRLNLLGMEVGETRTFDVPPEEGYGAEPVRNSQGVIVIPANSTLTFEVTVLAIR